MNPIERYTILRLWIKNTRTIPTIDNRTIFEIWFETFKQGFCERIYRNIETRFPSMPKKDLKAAVEQQLHRQPIIKDLLLTYLNEQGKKTALEMMKFLNRMARERERGKTKKYIKNQLYEELGIPDGKGTLKLLTFPKRLTIKAAYTELIHLVRTIKKRSSYFEGAFDDQTPVHELLTELELDTLAEMLDRNESPAQITLALIHNRVNQFLERNNKKTITKKRLKDILSDTPSIYTP